MARTAFFTVFLALVVVVGQMKFSRVILAALVGRVLPSVLLVKGLLLVLVLALVQLAPVVVVVVPVWPVVTLLHQPAGTVETVLPHLFRVLL
jgi:hypothetical protein